MAVTFSNGFYIGTNPVIGSPTPTPSVTPTLTPTPQLSNINLIVNLKGNDLSSYPTSGNTWFDISGYANDATITNASFTSDYDGVFNFDGNNDYMFLGQPLSNGSSYTLSAWVNASDATSARNIISSTSSPFWLNSGFLYAGIDNSYTEVSSASFPTNQWVYVTVSFNDSTNTMTLYKDGTVVDQNTNVTNTYTSENMYIGSHYTASPVSFFLGMIGEISIYDGAISDADILQNYNNTKSRYLVTPTPTPTITSTPTGTPASTPDATPTPSVTNTMTPTPSSTEPSVTPTPTPSATPSSGATFSGYTYVVQCSSGGLTNGDLFLFSDQMSTITYDPAATVADGIIAFSVYDNDDIDRTSFYSTLTGTTTLRMTQGGNSVTFAVSSGAFMYQSSGQQLFLYDGAGFGDGKLTVTSQTGGAFTCGQPMTIEIAQTQGGGSGSGSWYFYETSGTVISNPPLSNGEILMYTNAGGPPVSTYDPNNGTGAQFILFYKYDSTGTDYTTQFTNLQTNGGTINITQNGNTATYVGGSGVFNFDPAGFLVIPTAIQTVTVASPFTYGDKITLSFS